LRISIEEKFTAAPSGGLGALPTFEEAIYFSIVTFTTVGYGEIVLDREWRQLATFEAVNGWIIFGWATALMMVVIQRLYQRNSADGADQPTAQAFRLLDRRQWRT
jgi:voltage-gated potassium channel Kch